MDALLITTGIVLGIVAFVVAVAQLGRWILGPIDRAARARQARVRYSIADFLCLFVIIQIPLAAAYRLSRDEETMEYYWFFTGITWIAAPLIWFVATRALSKAGVVSGFHRIAFMGLVVPLVYYGLLPFGVLTFLVIGTIVASDGPPFLAATWFKVLWPTLGFLLFVSGLYTRSMVRGMTDASCLPKPDEA